MPKCIKLEVNKEITMMVDINYSDQTYPSMNFYINKEGFSKYFEYYLEKDIFIPKVLNMKIEESFILDYGE